MVKNTIEDKINFGLIKDLVNGCDVFGRKEAAQIREIQKVHPDWVDIIDNMNELEKIKGVPYPDNKYPYFGVILTDEGVEGFKEIFDNIFG